MGSASSTLRMERRSRRQRQLDDGDVLEEVELVNTVPTTSCLG